MTEKTLFEPHTLGGLTHANRIVMWPGAGMRWMARVKG